MRCLVLISLCLSLHTCRTSPRGPPDLRSDPPGLPFHPDPLDEELGGGRSWNGTGGSERCGPCRPDSCPESRGCRAGLVPDRCGCCRECGSLEGQACDPGGRSASRGRCGTGLRCQADPWPAAGGGAAGGAAGGGEDEEEEVCVCEEQEVLCGSDGTTYMNMCQFREAKFNKPELRATERGPCKTVPLIKVPPLSQVKVVGGGVAFLCEVFAFPMALVEWRKEGQEVVLPGDDPHISVQTRGGPLKFELSSWLQIEGAEPGDAGTYRCVARNAVGVVSAVAALGVLRADQLSSHLTNSMSEMKRLMDYDLDDYY